MLKKGSFQWDGQSRKSFEDLKKALLTPPVLQMPNFDEEFDMECDVSRNGIGAVLTHQGHPITFYSQNLKGKSLSYSAYEKEMLPILSIVRKWRQYLLGRRFTIRTYQKSIKFLLD